MIRVKCPRCHHLYQLQSSKAGRKVKCKQADCGTVFNVPGLPAEATVDDWEDEIPTSGANRLNTPHSKRKKTHKPDSTIDRGTLVKFGGALLGLVAFSCVLGHFLVAPVKPVSSSPVSPNIASADFPLSTTTPTEPSIPSVTEQTAAPSPPENQLTTPPPSEAISAEPVEEVAAASPIPILPATLMTL